MLSINFKRGDTFELPGQYLVDKVAAALPPGIRSQLRDASGELVAELTVSRVDEAGGLYTLTFGDTTAWKPGRPLYGDVQFTGATGKIISMNTYMVNVIADVTHD